MANTTNFGWETPDDTDLVKDGAAAIRTLGGAIDTSLVDLKGGTTGQVLSKNTNTDMDFTWVTPNDADAIQNSIVDAKGDLISASAADTPARLASSGVNGDVLTVDTTTATGLKWATPSQPSYTWTSYTPTFTSLTVGNGTVDAKYLKVGKVVFISFLFTFGSTSSISGAPTITLPSGSTSNEAAWAKAFFVDSGATSYLATAQTFAGGTTMSVYVDYAGATYGYVLNPNATTPFTWTTNDRIEFLMTYEEA